jgi:predicted nucleic acid-binding protein
LVEIKRRLGLKVVKEIGKILGLILIEPDAVLVFEDRYAALSDKLHRGVNDALLLQLMLDAGITQLFSYDKQFNNRAASLGITLVVD